MNEIFKDIPNYEGYYQVSNFGNIKSLSRVSQNLKRKYITKEIILKQGINFAGYKSVKLLKEKVYKTYQVQSLVALAFLNHSYDKDKKIVIDHINSIKTDNRLENLQLITQRENVAKDKKNKTSKYTGVCFEKSRNIWRAVIRNNGKEIFLGRFKCEILAKKAYDDYLYTII